MIDEKDSFLSTLSLLSGKTLKNWNTKAVLKLLFDEARRQSIILGNFDTLKY